MSDHASRFGGIARLFGAEKLERLRRAHVCVVGLGGVGSWAVEALARSAVGTLTLIDLDDVCVSNVNRQLHALDGAIGRPKVEVMAERARAINPDCTTCPVAEFFSEANADQMLATPFDFVIDAIDGPSNKALLIAKCRERGLRIVASGGAAGRRDPTAIRVADLAFSSHDRLLSQVRRVLRRFRGFPRGEQPFGVDCVFSAEPPLFPQQDGSVCGTRDPEAPVQIDCEHGLGTATFVTGAFGFAAASVAVRGIVEATRS
ncbi:MAG: tRNA threonylcarbamoyladenosine dehydratase [Verrucomicrobia bacterium]|nr:tRNA threonylcarbamoyladenosine dehydratase [Verrucomicrobiota bacterium]